MAFTYVTVATSSTDLLNFLQINPMWVTLMWLLFSHFCPKASPALPLTSTHFVGRVRHLLSYLRCYNNTRPKPMTKPTSISSSLW